MTFGTPDRSTRVNRTFDIPTKIEEDISNPSHFFITDRGALFYVDSEGGSRAVVGQYTNSFRDIDYQEGRGTEAIFIVIEDFLQYNSSHIALADTFNDCVRVADRETWTTRPLIGECGGYRKPKAALTSADPKQNVLDLPLILVNDSRRNELYVFHGRDDIIIYSVDSHTIGVWDLSPRDLAVPNDLLSSTTRVTINQDLLYIYVSSQYISNIVFNTTSGEVVHFGFNTHRSSSKGYFGALLRLAPAMLLSPTNGLMFFHASSGDTSPISNVNHGYSPSDERFYKELRHLLAADDGNLTALSVSHPCDYHNLTVLVGVTGAKGVYMVCAAEESLEIFGPMQITLSPGILINASCTFN